MSEVIIHMMETSVAYSFVDLDFAIPEDDTDDPYSPDDE
jgi:hypothetical protein